METQKKWRIRVGKTMEHVTSSVGKKDVISGLCMHVVPLPENTTLN